MSKMSKNKSDKIMAVTLSMLMIGTTAMPTLRGTESSFSSVYAESSSRLDKNMWNYYSAIYSEEEGVKIYFINDRESDSRISPDDRNYYESMIKDVIINGQRFPYSQFSKKSYTYEHMSDDNYIKKHSEAWKSVENKSNVVLGFALKNGKIHEFTTVSVDKGPGSEKGTKDIFKIKDDVNSPNTEDNVTDKQTGKKDIKKAETIPEEHMESTPTVREDGLKFGFNYKIGENLMNEYFNKLTHVIINGQPFSKEEFRLVDKWGTVKSKENFINKHLKAWDSSDKNINKIVMIFSDGKKGIWESPAFKAAVERGDKKEGMYESLEGKSLTEHTEKSEENQKGKNDEHNSTVGDEPGEAIEKNTSEAFKHLKIDDVTVDKETQVYKIKLSGYSEIDGFVGLVNDPTLFWSFHMQELLKSVEIDGYDIPYSFTANKVVSYHENTQLLTVKEPHLNGFLDKSAHRVVLKFHSKTGSGYNIKKDKTKEDGEIVFQQKGYIAPKPGEAEKAASEYEKNKKTEEEKKEAKYTTSDNIPDGTYTIGFNALLADGREGTSMLEGFFDKNVKLVVENGKMKITMLNTLFADVLYDFQIQSGGKWPGKSEKKFCGEANANNIQDHAEFTMNISDLNKEHIGGVLVGPMGGQKSDIGQTDKYTRVKIVFKPEVYEGWTGYDEPKAIAKKKESSKKALQDRLKASGVIDTNGDGTIDGNEIKSFSGELKLSRGLGEEVDRGAIYDISLLAGNIGPGITSIDLGGNHIESIPKDLLKGATGLKKFYIGGNAVKFIPSGLFDDCKELEEVKLNSNVIGKLPSGIFDKNTKLKTLELSKIWLTELPTGIFDKLKNLESIDLSENNIREFDNDVFKNNSKIKFMNLSQNKLEKLPDSISKASSLENLSAYNNKLTKLPDNFGELNNVKTLRLSNNMIESIDNKVWSKLASKDDAIIDLHNNMLTSIPESILRNNKKRKLDLAYNMMDEDIKISNPEELGISANLENGYFPQKKAYKVKANAQNKKIQVSTGDINMIDMAYWKRPVKDGEHIPQTKRGYIEKRDQLAGADLKEYLVNKENGPRWNWKVVTKVEKIKFNIPTFIGEATTSNELDKKVEIKDPSMRNGDKYRVTKTLYLSRSSADRDTYEFEVSSDVVASVDNDNGNSADENRVLEYSLPVKLVKYGQEDQASMGADAMKSMAKVVESRDGVKISLKFQPKEMLFGGVKMRGHLYKFATYNSLDDIRNHGRYTEANRVETSDYTDGGKTFPGEVEFVRDSRGEEKIGVRVWVDAMDEVAKKANPNADASQPAVLLIDWSKAPKDSSIDKNKLKGTQGEEEGILSSKAVLKNNIEIGEKLLKAGVIEGRSREMLEKALARAKDSINTNDRVKMSIANEVVLFAIDNIKKESGSSELNNPSQQTDIKNIDKDIANKEIKNGAKLYSVPVKLWHAFDNKASMGNASLEKTAIVSEKDGKYTYYVDFKGMEFMGMHGHLWGLSVYDSDSNSSLKEAKVEKEIEDKDLNGNMRKFPSRYSFVRDKKEKEIFTEVNVDAMDSISSNAKSYDAIVKGSGKQKAKLIFDWSQAKEYKKLTGNYVIKRLAGNDRYETATKISQKFFNKADTVILASGTKNADALVSASFASTNEAPILLTEKANVPASVKAEITRLGAKKVILSGGLSSMSGAVESQLRSMGLSVERVAGKNRFETAAMVAQRVKNKSNSNKVILINGEKDADALTVSSLATQAGVPVLMTRANSLDPNAKAKINEWKPEEVIVVGGNSSISEGVMRQINAKSKVRISGRTRFDTALAIANKAYPDAKTIFVSNGYNAVDSLSAGAVTGLAKASIILAEKNKLPASVVEKLKGNKDLIILGGNNTIDANIENSIK